MKLEKATSERNSKRTVEIDIELARNIAAKGALQREVIANLIPNIKGLLEGDSPFCAVGAVLFNTYKKGDPLMVCLDKEKKEIFLLNIIQGHTWKKRVAFPYKPFPQVTNAQMDQLMAGITKRNHWKVDNVWAKQQTKEQTIKKPTRKTYKGIIDDLD